MKWAAGEFSSFCSVSFPYLNGLPSLHLCRTTESRSLVAPSSDDGAKLTSLTPGRSRRPSEDERVRRKVRISQPHGELAHVVEVPRVRSCTRLSWPHNVASLFDSPCTSQAKGSVDMSSSRTQNRLQQRFCTGSESIYCHILFTLKSKPLREKISEEEGALCERVEECRATKILCA